MLSKQKQGDLGDTFNIIKEGCAVCTKADDYKPAIQVELMKLGVGDYFGERALLELAPRAANVIAVGKVTCVEISKKGSSYLPYLILSHLISSYLILSSTIGFEEVLGPLSTLIQQDREKREKTAYAIELVRKNQEKVEYFAC